MVAPLIHFLFPTVDSLGRDDLREDVESITRPFSNFPVVSPLGVIHRVNWRHWQVVLCESAHLLVVFPCLLLVLWGGTDLVMVLRLDIFKLFSLVVSWGYRVEVPLHKIDIITVVLEIYSWISDDADSEFVERFCHLLAKVNYVFRILVLSADEFVEIDDWDVVDGYFLLYGFHVYLR